MSKRFFNIAALCLIGACTIALTTHLSFAKGIDPNAKALAALDKEWSDAAAAKNLDKLASFYAEDAVVYPPNEPVLNGRAAARESWGKMLAAPDFKMSWTTESAGVNGNLGYTAGTYEDSYKDAAGKTVSEKGKYLCVWRKGADGKWQAIHDMWNSDSK
jgi:ketosteroid isomerase-like protein